MTLGGQPTSREPVIPSDIITEWKTYRQLTKWWIPSSQTYRLSQESVSQSQYRLHLWKEAFF